MKEWYSASELVGLPGLPTTVQNINDKAKKSQWKSRTRKGRGGGSEYHIDDFPDETLAALPHSSILSPVSENTDTVTSYDRDALWRHYERKPQKQKDKAKQKLDTIADALALIEHGIANKTAFSAIARARGIHVSTLYKWYGAVLPYQRADWLAALTPGYTGCVTTSDCSPEAWDYYKADYLRLEKPASTACYDRLERAAKEHGWTIPSLRTLERRLDRELSHATIVRAREGVEALKRKYPAQLRDRTVFHAIEAVNADGHRFDVFVKWPDGEVNRPNMVAWQDVYSGKLLSWRIDKTENTDAVRLSFGDMVERFGIPEHAYLDNGRGFASKWMTGGSPTRYRFKVKEEEPAGILTTIGVQVHWTTPYHGQAKPIERAFRDLCEYVAKHPAFSGAYTGNSPNAKPENYASRAIALDDFLDILGQEIDAHNDRKGRRSPTCNGQSFDVTFNTSYQQSAIRKATREQRRLWLLAAEGVRVHKDGTIVLKTDRDNRYWSDELYAYRGRHLIVRFDPQHLHDLVHVSTYDNRYIGEAECIEAAGFNDTQKAREHNKNRNRWMRSKNDQLGAERRMGALEAAKLLPVVERHEDPDARVVRPHRPAIELRTTPEPTPKTEAERAAHEAFVKQFEAESAIAPLRKQETKRQTFQRWVRTKRTAATGAAMTEEDIEFLTIYPQEIEFRAQLKLHREHGLLVDGLPIEDSIGQEKRSPHEAGT